MAEIIPAPQTGTWLRITGWDGNWAPQPQAGTWLRITGTTGFPWGLPALNNGLGVVGGTLGQVGYGVIWPSEMRPLLGGRSDSQIITGAGSASQEGSGSEDIPRQMPNLKSQ